eukprot:Sspe_Gene.9118::Locus_3071_Transcript_4_4_Confidence_0.500_Length_3082::g.9118::m.9118/K16457/CEP76; centrosomal protein CEP76
MEGLPPDKLRELRRVVDRHLRENNVYSQIREVLAEFVAGGEEEPGSEALLDVVQERGILGKLISSLQPDGESRSTAGPVPGGKSRFLHVRLLGGKAFLENLDVNPSVPTKEELLVCLHFGGQRFQSTAVPCVCDPEFDDDFLINLDKELPPRPPWDPVSALQRIRDLLHLSTQLHFVVVKVDHTGSRRYVGENTVEWRSVLKAGAVTMSVELGGGATGMNVPVGVLELQLEVLPVVGAAGLLAADDIANQLNSERSNQTAADREFLVYARRWLGEYHSYSPDLHHRHVKVFTNLTTHIARMVPVTAFVRPLRADRVLDSPLQAARLVSLMTFDKDDDRAMGHGIPVPSAGAVSLSSWSSPFAFLCKGKGDSADHANLLCSLLLGFGLDAWVALGKDSGGKPAVWVLTRSSSAVSGGQPTVLLWDVLTGARHHVSGPPPSDHPGVSQSGRYARCRIHCAYTHGAFVANLQVDDLIPSTHYDFDTERLWKGMNPLKLKLVKPVAHPPLLPPSQSSSTAVEEAVEAGLVQAIAAHREQRGLPTHWDQQTLPYVLTQALWGYEMEKLSGVGMDSALFESAVRGTISKGCNCTAFPVHFSHHSPSRIMAHFLESRVTREVVELVGDEAVLTVRVKVFLYPEDVTSTWVMLAAVHRMG